MIRSFHLALLAAAACATRPPRAVTPPIQPVAIEVAAEDQPTPRTSQPPSLPKTPVWLDPFPEERMRTHVGADLVEGSAKQWAGPSLPAFIADRDDGLQLVLLDASPEGWLTLYRELYEVSEPLNWRNRDYRARLYRADGTVSWTVELNPHFKRKRHLEVQDIRLADGILYYNEACQTYSAQARGRCSYLVALDPAENRLVWRTRPRTSNGRILVHKSYIITGYGFTDEKDRVVLVRRSDGKILDRASVQSKPVSYVVVENTLRVGFQKGAAELDLIDLDGKRPRLEPKRRRQRR